MPFFLALYSLRLECGHYSHLPFGLQSYDIFL